MTFSVFFYTLMIYVPASLRFFVYKKSHNYHSLLRDSLGIPIPFCDLRKYRAYQLLTRESIHGLQANDREKYNQDGFRYLVNLMTSC